MTKTARLASYIITCTTLCVLASCSSGRYQIPGFTSRDNSFVLLAVGDISHPHTSDYIAEFRTLGRAKYAPTRPMMQTADLAFANLETPFTAEDPVVEKQFAFATDPEELDYISWAGFNLLSLANNHAHDAGYAGINDTIIHLEKIKTEQKEKNYTRPFVWAGTGRTETEAEETKFFTLPGKHFRFAFLAYANNKNKLVHTFDDEKAINDVAAIKARYPDTIIIVSVHMGTEYQHIPGPFTRYAYRALIDAGATVILGHHPHVVQGIEHYRNGIICYSLGNFSFGSYTSRHLDFNAKMYGMIVGMQFTRQHGSLKINLRVFPLYVDNLYTMQVGDKVLEPTPFVPEPVKEPFSSVILNAIMDWSYQIPGNRLRFTSNDNYLAADVTISTVKEKIATYAEQTPDS